MVLTKTKVWICVLSFIYVVMTRNLAKWTKYFPSWVLRRFPLLPGHDLTTSGPAFWELYEPMAIGASIYHSLNIEAIDPLWELRHCLMTEPQRTTKSHTLFGWPSHSANQMRHAVLMTCPQRSSDWCMLNQRLNRSTLLIGARYRLENVVPMVSLGPMT